MEVYKSGIGVTAGSLMLKWNMIDEHVRRSVLNIQPGDNVNVFINLECVLHNLSMYKGILTAVNFYKQKMVIELESGILNLMASYKAYFRRLKCNVKMYFYITSLSDNQQQMSVYNKFYRNYYHNRYMQNPQFKPVGDLLNSTIIPEVELILSYIDKCYLLKADTFDGSIIPYIVSKFDDISGDIFDTLYMMEGNFLDIYIKRRFNNFGVYSTIDDTVRSIIKEESPFDISIFNSEMYYRLLLAIKGSKIRNIKAAKGFGYGKFMNILKDGLDKGIVLRDFGSIDSILELFPKQYQEDIKIAFICTNIETQYQLLSDTDISNIKSQIIDKVDDTSLNALNNKRFLDYPINLPSLMN
jgi:hypothetical protein